MHVHTDYSYDGHQTVSFCIEEASQRELDFLAITDHRNVDHLFDDNWHSDKVLLVSGIEWGGGGHANMFGLRTDNTCNYDDYNAVIQSWKLGRLQGAVQSLNHYGDNVGYWTSFLASRPEALGMLNVFETLNMWWTVGKSTNSVSIPFWEGLLNKNTKSLQLVVRIPIMQLFLSVSLPPGGMQEIFLNSLFWKEREKDILIFPIPIPIPMAVGLTILPFLHLILLQMQMAMEYMKR